MNKALALAVLAFAAQATDTATTVTATVEGKEVKFEAKDLEQKLRDTFLTSDRTKVKEDWQTQLREAIWPADQAKRGTEGSSTSSYNTKMDAPVSTKQKEGTKEGKEESADAKKFYNPVDAVLKSNDSADWMKCQSKSFKDLADGPNKNACTVLREEIAKIYEDTDLGKLTSPFERIKDNKAAFVDTSSTNWMHSGNNNDKESTKNEAKLLIKALKECKGTDYDDTAFTDEKCKAAYAKLDQSEMDLQTSAYNRLYATDAKKWTNFFWISWGEVTYWNHFMARWGSVTTLTTFVCDLFMWTIGLPITLERVFTNWGGSMDVNDATRSFFRTVGYACYGIYPAVFFGFLYLCLTKKIFVKHTGKAMKNETIRKLLGRMGAKNDRIQRLLNDWEDKTDDEKAATHLHDKVTIEKQDKEIEKQEEKIEKLKEELENKDDELDDTNNTIVYVIGACVVGGLAVAVGVVLCKKKSNDDTEA